MKKTAIVTLLVLSVLCVGMALSSDKTVRDATGAPVIGGPLTLNENLTWSHTSGAATFSGTWCYLGDNIDFLLFKTELPNGQFEIWGASRIPGTFFYTISGAHPFFSFGGDPHSFNMMD